MKKKINKGEFETKWEIINKEKEEPRKNVEHVDEKLFLGCLKKNMIDLVFVWKCGYDCFSFRNT